MRESDDFMTSAMCCRPSPIGRRPEFEARKAEAQAIIDHHLGWDITDYGLGSFDTMGLFLFTVRNGDAADLTGGAASMPKRR